MEGEIHHLLVLLKEMMEVTHQEQLGKVVVQEVVVELQPLELEMALQVEDAGDVGGAGVTTVQLRDLQNKSWWRWWRWKPGNFGAGGSGGGGGAGSPPSKSN